VGDAVKPKIPIGPPYPPEPILCDPKRGANLAWLNNIMQHPRTSAAGLMIAVVTIGSVLSQQGITLGTAGKGTVVALICGLATALLGLISKDPS